MAYLPSMNSASSFPLPPCSNSRQISIAFHSMNKSFEDWWKKKQVFENFIILLLPKKISTAWLAKKNHRDWVNYKPVQGLDGMVAFEMQQRREAWLSSGRIQTLFLMWNNNNKKLCVEVSFLPSSEQIEENMSILPSQRPIFYWSKQEVEISP